MGDHITYWKTRNGEILGHFYKSALIISEKWDRNYLSNQKLLNKK